MKFLIYGVLALAGASTAPAATILFSIGGTEFGQPSRVTAFDPVAQTAAPLFDLQSQTAGFSGLTYNSVDGMFYAVMDDPAMGFSELVKFAPNGGGAFTNVMDLVYPTFVQPLDFNGGLIFDPNDDEFYSIGNASTGNSFLFRIDVPGNTVQRLTESLPLSFNGGLTLNSDGTLDGMLNDGVPQAYVYAFTLHPTSAGVSHYFLGPVGEAYYGGLYWDGATFYALNSDLFGGATLNTLDNSGNATPQFGVGNGFNNAGLTGIPGVPEPGTTMLTGVGCVVGIILIAKKRRKTKWNQRNFSQWPCWRSRP